jgi:hypothetical protein
MFIRIKEEIETFQANLEQFFWVPEGKSFVLDVLFRGFF